MKYLEFLVCFLVLLAILIFACTLYFFQMAMCRKPHFPKKNHGPHHQGTPDAFEKRIREGMDWFKAQDKERIFRESYDGLHLAADLLPAKGDPQKARGVLLLMHGFHGSAAHDFSCAIRFYHELGFHLLCPHQRAHGKSEGNYICYGVKERYDCRMWAEYTAERFGEKMPIFLDGISMGASTVLMTSCLPLPVNVRGIIADCGFTSPWDIFVSVLKSWLHLPAFPLLYLTEWVCRLRAGFGFRDCSTIEALETNSLPVLFVHGKADDFVPCWMTQAAYEACRSPKELYLVEGAAHGMSYLVEEELLKEALVRFFDTYGGDAL